MLDNVIHNQRQVSSVRTFVEKLIRDECQDSPCDEIASPVTVQHDISNQYLCYIKGNYVEKKGTHLGIHWQMLKNW